MRPASVRDMFNRLKRVAGITDKRVSPHTCRHWFAVNAIKRGMLTAALRDLLGHETWKMIEVYVRLAEQDKKDIYTRFSPVDTLEMHHTSIAECLKIELYLTFPFLTRKKVAAMLEPSLRILSGDGE